MERRLADILEANAEARGRVVAGIEGLAQSAADWRPSDAEWSVGEIAHHVVLAEDAIRGAVERSIARHQAGKRFEALPDAERTLPLLELAARRGTFANGPLKNPEPVTPNRGRPVADLVLELERGAVVSRQAFEGLDADLLRQLTCPHPLFGVLTLLQYVELLGVHDRDHADQMAKVRAHPNFPRP
jgi:hypothetical protein